MVNWAAKQKNDRITHQHETNSCITMVNSIMNFFQQIEILPPAAKMNNRKQNKKTPLIPQQTRQHDSSEDDRGKSPCSKCFPVKRHELIRVNRMITYSYPKGFESSILSLAYTAA